MFQRTLRRLVQEPYGRYWGAPRTSQWTSFPWYLLSVITGLAFGIGCCEFKDMLLNADASSEYTSKRKAQVVQADYLGLGFWDITYVFQMGPRNMASRRVHACTFHPGKFGEFIWPFRSDYKELTTVGSTIDVCFKRGQSVHDNICVSPGYWSPYVPIMLMWLAAVGYSTRVTWRKAVYLMKLNTLHTTQPGLTLLRRGEMHALTNAPGENPVDRYLASAHPMGGATERGNVQYVWGLREWQALTRTAHEEAAHQHRATLNQTQLHELRAEAQHEREERAEEQGKGPNP